MPKNISDTFREIDAERELLNKSDESIIEDYIGQVPVQSPLIKYTANKFAFREVLVNKQYDKILEYTDFDLQCMTRRGIGDIHMLEYIFVNCRDEIILHIVDNCTNFDMEPQNKLACGDYVRNILGYACRHSSMYIVKYIMEKGAPFIDSYWDASFNGDNNDSDNRFFNRADIYMIDYIFSKGTKTGTYFLNMMFHKDGENYKKVYHCIDNHLNFNDCEFVRKVLNNNIPPEILKYVLSKGIYLEEQTLYPDFVNHKYMYYTPVHYLIAHNRESARVKLFIDAGANLECKAYLGYRPIHTAI